MPAPRDLDPSSSPLAFFGAELRRLRTAAGLTQEQLGARIAYSAAMVGAIETARRLPSSDFARAADEALGGDGLLSRLWGLVRRETYPLWFRPWVDIEREATTLRYWAPLLVPGLLQTEAYARAVFRASRPTDTAEEIEQQITARLERQQILRGERAPLVWVIVNEQVLRQPVGGAKVMRDQVERLVAAAQEPKIKVQVLPREVGEHIGLSGAFALAALPDSSEVALLETAVAGQVTGQPDTLSRLNLAFDTLQAEALALRASTELLERTAQSWS